MKTYKPTNNSDEQNPDFIFSGTSNELLIAIIKGDINALDRAKKELSNRGIDLNNKWVGFNKAKTETKKRINYFNNTSRF